MNRRDLQNEQLDRVERELLKAGKITDERIEEIVGAPQLYRRIREKIAAEKSRREPAAQKVSVWYDFRFRNWRKAGLALTAVAVLILGAATFFMRVAPPPITQQAPAEKRPAPVASESRSESIAPQIPEPPPKEFRPRKIAPVKKAQSTIAASSALKPAGKIKPSPPGRSPEPEAPFTALTFAGDFETGEERRIVRVELPPAQLLALGVAVQTENESEKIKTDLLVGIDGVARAIRVVK